MWAARGVLFVLGDEVCQVGELGVGLEVRRNEVSKDLCTPSSSHSVCLGMEVSTPLGKPLEHPKSPSSLLPKRTCLSGREVKLTR